jgi:hypothetical protein
MAKVHVMELGGAIKKLTRKASLQNPYKEYIMTPRQLRVGCF